MIRHRSSSRAGSALGSALAGLALATGLALPPPAYADGAPRAGVGGASAAGAPARVTAAPATFDALAAIEDDGLAARRASGGDWSTGEVVLVVLLLIFLFPIGLIVLIVLVIVKA